MSLQETRLQINSIAKAETSLTLSAMLFPNKHQPYVLPPKYITQIVNPNKLVHKVLHSGHPIRSYEKTGLGQVWNFETHLCRERRRKRKHGKEGKMKREKSERKEEEK